MLTNFHVLHVGQEVKVNGKIAKIVRVDPVNDLCLLAVATRKVDALTFAEKVSQDEEVVIYGNPLGHKDVILHGRIIDIADNRFYTDAHVFSGSSGSGVYNLKGEFVGIVSAIEGKENFGFPYGVIVTAKTVYEFLAD